VGARSRATVVVEAEGGEHARVCGGKPRSRRSATPPQCYLRFLVGNPVVRKHKATQGLAFLDVVIGHVVEPEQRLHGCIGAVDCYIMGGG